MKFYAALLSLQLAGAAASRVLGSDTLCVAPGTCEPPTDPEYVAFGRTGASPRVQWVRKASWLNIWLAVG